MIEAYFVRWAISNVIALMLLFLCWKYPKSGRYGFGVIFLSASIVNSLTSIFGPQNYLEYRHFAIFEFYRTFIEGFFADHIQAIVLTIAAGQLLISIGLFYGRFLFKPAVLGGILFSIAIIPLGVGAGMPVPLLMIMALFILLRPKVQDTRDIVT
ncbi:MAG: hypothetical protein ABJG78_02115 [Cyclobacteriaceae bacterium]